MCNHSSSVKCVQVGVLNVHTNTPEISIESISELTARACIAQQNCMYCARLNRSVCRSVVWRCLHQNQQHHTHTYTTKFAHTILKLLQFLKCHKSKYHRRMEHSIISVYCRIFIYFLFWIFKFAIDFFVVFCVFTLYKLILNWYLKREHVFCIKFTFFNVKIVCLFSVKMVNMKLNVKFSTKHRDISRPNQ